MIGTITIPVSKPQPHQWTPGTRIARTGDPFAPLEGTVGVVASWWSDDGVIHTYMIQWDGAPHPVEIDCETAESYFSVIS